MVIGSFIASAFQAPRMTGRERIICHISYTSSMGLNVSGGPYSQCKELETLGSETSGEAMGYALCLVRKPVSIEEALGLSGRPRPRCPPPWNTPG
jgi:hypothetical protein